MSENRSRLSRLLSGLFNRGVNLPRGSGFTAWSVFGLGVPGLKGVVTGLPGLAFLGMCSVAFWLLLRSIGGYVLYVVVVVGWIFIFRVIWISRSKIQPGRLRLLMTATRAQIEEAEEAARVRRIAESTRLVERRSRDGVIEALDERRGLVWVSVEKAEGGGMAEPESFPVFMLSGPVSEAFRGAPCRLVESEAVVGGSEMGVVRIVLGPLSVPESSGIA